MRRLADLLRRWSARLSPGRGSASAPPRLRILPGARRGTRPRPGEAGWYDAWQDLASWEAQDWLGPQGADTPQGHDTPPTRPAHTEDRPGLPRRAAADETPERWPSDGANGLG